MGWNTTVLAWICGVCCGILFMLIPTVTAYFKGGSPSRGGPRGRAVNDRVMRLTVPDVLAARQAIRSRGYVLRERRSL